MNVNFLVFLKTFQNSVAVIFYILYDTLMSYLGGKRKFGKFYYLVFWMDLAVINGKIFLSMFLNCLFHFNSHTSKGAVVIDTFEIVL